MKKFKAVRSLTVGGALVASTILLANNTRFSDFSPLTSSAGPTADESAPITFGNPDFEQRSIANRTGLVPGTPNTGSWDMNTVNETGPHKGRYLFTVFETGQSGVQRHDLETGETETIWQSITPGTHTSFDPSYWTPWGTFITAEESWETNPNGSTSIHGRLFEFKNPLTAPAVVTPLTATSNSNADFVHQNVIPRVAHEGIQFDQDGNMYFIDELNGGSLYKFTSASAKRGTVNNATDYFDAGQTFVLRVGDGNTPNATGSYRWIPITDEDGAGLPGTITITDTNGVKSVDGRNTTDRPLFKGTDYQRPEDIQIQTVKGDQFLYVSTTSTHEVYVLNLKKQTIAVFANRNTIDLGDGPAGRHGAQQPRQPRRRP